MKRAQKFTPDKLPFRSAFRAVGLSREHATISFFSPFTANIDATSIALQQRLFLGRPLVFAGFICILQEFLQKTLDYISNYDSLKRRRSDSQKFDATVFTLPA